jgi:hypothetical protein
MTSSNPPENFVTARNSLAPSPVHPIIGSNATPGSSANPINVDTLPDPPLFNEADAFQTLAETKRACNGMCVRCGQRGHYVEDCDTKMRSFDHCDACAWLSIPQHLCYHYDLTPADAKRLCGDKIPYDHQK